MQFSWLERHIWDVEVARSSRAIPTIWACLVLIGNDQVRKHAETVLRETQTINARVIDFTPSVVVVRVAA